MDVLSIYHWMLLSKHAKIQKEGNKELNCDFYLAYPAGNNRSEHGEPINGPLPAPLRHQVLGWQTIHLSHPVVLSPHTGARITGGYRNSTPLVI